MKARNREINIFNMSLLDILCGALGVFCFMTLVLFPYWRPTGANAEDLEKNKLAIEQELKELKRKLGESADGKQMLQQVEQLEQRLQQQQGDLNRAKQELAESDKKLEKLEMRNPIVTSVRWNGPHDVDVFLEPVNYGYPSGKMTQRMDPLKKQGINFTGEAMADYYGGPASDVWLTRDLVGGGEIKVYYKLITANGSTAPAQLGGYFLANDRVNLLPEARITQERTAVWVGTLKSSKDYQVTFEASPQFKESFAKELEEYRKQSQKGTTP
jgi:hypothetical protein